MLTVTGIIIICLGIGVFTLMFTLNKKNTEEEKNCTSVTKGEIIDFKVVEDHNTNSSLSTGKWSKKYYPIVKYMINGTEYEKTSFISKTVDGRPINNIGDAVNIHYNPQAPNTAYIDGYKRSMNVFSILLLPGVSIMFGILIFFI